MHLKNLLYQLLIVTDIRLKFFKNIIHNQKI
jgi:hypothetical protein